MKRGLYKTRAVILNSIDFGESDRILTFYTHGHGKVKGIAKGARRSRKRFVGNLDLLSHITLIFFRTDKSELVRVEDAALIEGFPGLKADIDKLSEACYLLELVSEMTREGQVIPQVFDLLLTFINMLGGGDADVLLRYFEIKLLSILGYLPHLDGCVACKSPFDGLEARISFSSEKGGAVCGNCSHGVSGLIAISPGTARFLSMAEKFDSVKLARLKPAAVFLEESEKLLDDFIKYQIGRELKTKKFISKLRNTSF